MTVWKNSEQNDARNPGQKCTNAPGNMKESYMQVRTHEVKCLGVLS